MFYLKSLSATKKKSACPQHKLILSNILLRLPSSKKKQETKNSHKMSIKFFTALFLVFQPNLSTAQNNTIWIKSNYTSFQEFLVFIESSNFTSYAEHLLKKKREQANNFKLKDILLKAQELYLSGEIERAVQIFKEISNLAYKTNWNKEDRRIIMYSLLRRAQTEEDKEKRKALLVLASDFFVFEINKENYSDYNLFPPPLIEQLQKIQTKKNNLSINWNKVFPHHEIILLNGQRLEKNKVLKLPQAVYKITALSSSHKAWSKNISLSELLERTIKTKSLTKGSCKKIELTKDLQLSDLKTAPISNCPRLNPLEIETQDKFAFNSNDLEKESKNPKKITENWPTWAVIGASVIVLSLALSLDSSKDDNKNDDFVY